MSAQRDEIHSQLAGHGWAASRLEDHELEWWADEIWLLESLWSPQGARAYLTFLVHPLDYTHDRRRGERVWAVGASARKPTDRLAAGAEFELSLSAGWRERLPALFDFLSAVRNSADLKTDGR